MIDLEKEIKRLSQVIETLSNELAITKTQRDYAKEELRALQVKYKNKILEKNKVIAQLTKEVTILNQKFNERY